jgi:hypothetical protein
MLVKHHLAPTPHRVGKFAKHVSHADNPFAHRQTTAMGQFLTKLG